jgi:hypothetical protein
MSKYCTCYELTGKFTDGRKVLYIGCVEVLTQQNCQDAADYRLGEHQRKRKWCLKDVAASSMSCTAVGQRLPAEQALLQETVLTVQAMKNHKDHKGVVVRGGPYCYSELSKNMLEELEELRAIFNLRTFAQQRAKVAEIAQGMPTTSSLRAHVEDRCYKCKKPGWKTCPCRAQVKSNPVPLQVSLLRPPKEPVAMRKRASGKRAPKARATHYMKRNSASPMKRRSGKSKSGHLRLQEKIDGKVFKKNSPDAKAFVHGTEFQDNRSRANAKQYSKRTRGS